MPTGRLQFGTPERTITRLSLYRRLLQDLRKSGSESIYSHDLAVLARFTSAQIRRDFMSIGYSGSPQKGYEVNRLLASIEQFLDPPEQEPVALVGVGNLGRAILAFFRGRRPKLTIEACFDIDPANIGRVIHGCRCHAVESVPEVVGALGIHTAVLAVPASAAQAAAERLVRAGVRGILNFAPSRLHVPAGVYVEDIDMTGSLEKVAYFARRSADREKVRT